MWAAAVTRRPAPPGHSVPTVVSPVHWPRAPRQRGARWSPASHPPCQRVPGTERRAGHRAGDTQVTAQHARGVRGGAPPSREAFGRDAGRLGAPCSEREGRSNPQAGEASAARRCVLTGVLGPRGACKGPSRAQPCSWKAGRPESRSWSGSRARGRGCPGDPSWVTRGAHAAVWCRPSGSLRPAQGRASEYPRGSPLAQALAAACL